MKRVITLALMALFIGSFTVSANAQDRDPKELLNFERRVSICSDPLASEVTFQWAEEAREKARKELEALDESSGKGGKKPTRNYYWNRFDKASKKLDELKEEFNARKAQQAQQTNSGERPTIDGNEVVSMLQNSDGNNGGSSSQVSNTSTPKKPKHTSNSASQSNANNLGSTENLLKSFEQAVNDGCQLYSTIKQRNNGKAMSKQDQVAINKKIQLAKQSKNSVSVSALNNSQKARYDKASKNLDSLINKYEHAKKS